MRRPQYAFEIITGNASAYKYLETSSRKFPCGEAFLDLVRTAGIGEALAFRKFSLGICYCYRLEVPASFSGAGGSEKASSSS